jgi:hypothetical protein
MEAEGAVGAGLVPTAESGIPSVYGRRGRWSPGLSAASSQRLGACAAPSLLVAARSGRIHFYVICRGSVPDLASGQTGRLGAWARPLGTEPCGVHVTRGQLGETPDVCCNCPDVETPCHVWQAFVMFTAVSAIVTVLEAVPCRPSRAVAGAPRRLPR